MFTYLSEIKGENFFRFGSEIRVTANTCLNKSVLKELWNGFCLRTSETEIDETDEMIFCVGEAPKLPTDGCMYSINVTTRGISLAADSREGLLDGFKTLLTLITPENLENGNEVLCVPCIQIKDKPEIKNRMLHFCVFPDTELTFIRKFIRMCGVLKYTHVVMEFWGMLRLDCMKELAWSFGYTKEQIRPIIDEASDMGLEIIPMFNHYGHAAQSRSIHGRHVVLDQNPRLQTLFRGNGWVWEIGKPQVRALMKQIREELSELCGEGKYFHIGCDEADRLDETEARLLTEYINEAAADLADMGRRPIMWGDMLLYKEGAYTKDDCYCCNCPSEKIAAMFAEMLDKRIVIADWQYDIVKAPLKSSLYFKEHGFDVLCAPWSLSYENMKACVETVTDGGLAGVMYTTWHTLCSTMPQVVHNAVSCYRKRDTFDVSTLYEPAALMRRVYFAGGVYKDAGWQDRENI